MKCVCVARFREEELVAWNQAFFRMFLARFILQPRLFSLPQQTEFTPALMRHLDESCFDLPPMLNK